MTPSAESTSPPLAALKLRVLCIGNGGLILRNHKVWNHRSVGDFLEKLAELLGDVRYCGWLEPVDDLLAQTSLSEIKGVRSVGLRPFRGPLAKRWFNGMVSFVRLVGEIFSADFVYVFWPGRLTSIAVRLCRAMGKPYGIYFRGEQIPFDPTFEKGFSHACFVLAAGPVLGATAQMYCKDVEIVTPMIALRPELIRAPRNVPDSRPLRLLYVGRLEERKGTKDLLEAAVILEREGVDFVLTLVGQGYDNVDSLEVLPHSVRDRIRAVGAVADFTSIVRHYCEADVFVFPSHDEGFPRVLYEAMAFGVPIVTTFVGSISGVMRDRHNCLRVETKNARDIADKVELLSRDPQLRIQIANAAHECIKDLMKKWGRPHSVQVSDRLRKVFEKSG